MWKAKVIKGDTNFDVCSKDIFYLLKCAVEVEKEGGKMTSAQWVPDRKTYQGFEPVRQFPRDNQACAICANAIKADNALYCESAYVALVDNGIAVDGVKLCRNAKAVAVEPWSRNTAMCDDFELDEDFAKDLIDGDDPYADDAFDHWFRNYGKSI